MILIDVLSGEQLPVRLARFVAGHKAAPHLVVPAPLARSCRLWVTLNTLRHASVTLNPLSLSYELM